MKAAYDDYVATLPASGYDSSGKLRYSPEPDYMCIYGVASKYHIGCEHYPGESYESPPFTFSFDCGANSLQIMPLSGGTSIGRYRAQFYYKGIAPVAGYYSKISTPIASGYWIGGDGKRGSYERNYTPSSTPVFYAAGASFSVYDIEYSFTDVGASYVLAQGLPPVYEITPVSALSGDAYNINSRPASITGGNYGIVGDNGQITKVEDNSTIVNETNNTFYNPATGVTVPITNWSYDYSDRSYKVTLESGDTVTITYGDENIVIKEGDTVYNIYYLIDGSGSENPPCAHEWAETSTTPAICTMPGSKLSTCSKCQKTKKEALPALGHDWQVKKTVTTEYDDTGQLVQQGYTIFECSRCHEQFKSTDGAAPPGGGGSGTDPGGEDKETIWDKLGNFIGSLGGGLVGLIEAVLGKLLDALTALAEKMMEKLKTVVEAILSIFDELPLIFGGFLDFLAALFPFLPPELMTILTFGILAVVFIGIIKAVRR